MLRALTLHPTVIPRGSIMTAAVDPRGAGTPTECVDAPRGCKQNFSSAMGMWSGAAVCPASRCGDARRGPLWKSADRVHYAYARSRRRPVSWFSRPRLLDRLPIILR